MADVAPSVFVGDDLGITPEVQSKLDHAAQLCRQAHANVEEAFEAAEPDSDAERRCEGALNELQGVLYQLEWAPPKEMAN